MKQRKGLLLLFLILLVLSFAISAQAAKVTLNKKSATIIVGKTITIKVKGTQKKTKTVFKSTNRKVATVSKKGLVKGIHAGATTIIVSVGKKKLKCKIKVVDSKTSKKNANAGKTANNPIVLDYHNINPDVYKGVWVSTGLGFSMYLPADWVLTDISDEEAAAGLVFRAGEYGGGANVCITCSAIPEELADTYDYDALKKELDGAGYSTKFVDMNGILAVGFDDEKAKVSGFTILSGDDTVISGTIAPPSDEEYESFTPYIRNMFMSIRPTK